LPKPLLNRGKFFITYWYAIKFSESVNSEHYTGHGKSYLYEPNYVSHVINNLGLWDQDLSINAYACPYIMGHYWYKLGKI